MAGKTYFNKNWLRNVNYSSWLQEVEDSPSLAFCRQCQKTVVLSNMGQAALNSHMNSKKHKTSAGLLAGCNKINQPSIDLFCKSAPSASLGAPVKFTKEDESTFEMNFSESPSVCKSLNEAPNEEDTLKIPEPPPAENRQEMCQPSLDKHIAKEDAVKAEIRWAIKMVLDHASFSSTKDLNMIFQAMFPDSQIAKHFQMGPSKSAYLICFGLGPFYESKLLKEIADSPCYTVSFDESFNKICKEEQMDILVRYVKGRQIVTSYFVSKFLGHTRASDLKRVFTNALEKLNPNKLLQISMDGPRTNFSFLAELTADRNQSDPDIPKLLETGSCSLHIIHGALSTGIQKSGWNLGKLLRAMFNLFDSAPARREDYTSVTKSTVFPKSFCTTRWVEDKDVAERAIEIWPNIIKFVSHLDKKKKSEVPSCESYHTVADAVHKDPLVVAKLEVLITVANEIKPFLTLFQTENPMVPFLSTHLEKVLRDLMSRIVKPDKLAEASTCTKLAQIDLSKEENLLPAKKVDVGFGAKSAISNIPSTKLTELQRLKFFNESRELIKAMIGKIVERSPLKYALINSLLSLDPKYMVAHPNHSVTLFRRVLEHLAKAGWKTSQECDAILNQYRALLSELKSNFSVKCTGFDEKKTRIDDFLFDEVGLHKHEEMKQLFEVILMLLTLFHGQAEIERGFSVNGDILQPNLKKESLVAIRMVHSGLTASGVKAASDVQITPAMILSCKHARARYQTYQDDQARQRKVDSEKRKRKAVQEQIDEAVEKKKKMEKAVVSIFEDADKKARKAETRHDFKLLAESNAIREKAKCMEKDITQCQKKIDELKAKV